MKLRQGKAPEIVWTENKNWINSKPLTLEQLHGKVVLLDFWTYSCVNCVRTLPALKAMWNKYKDKKWIIIGIHTPEFEFEKDLMNVQRAARKQGLEYPILNDPARINWENYGNTYWPRAAVINPEGEVILDHVGEAGYDEIEETIIEELRKMKEIGKTTVRPEERAFYHSEISPETYAGRARNQGIGSSRVCSKRGCDEFYDPGKYHKDIIYLQGDWKQTAEYLEFMGDQGHLAFQYFAREVNVVMDGQGAATILLNNEPVSESIAGKDVSVKFGRSLTFLEGAEMYNLLRKKEFHTGVIKILPFKGLKVYAFTFG